MFFNIIGQMVIGWILADFLSGVFHWWQDRWPSPGAILIGPYLIAFSRIHHIKPDVFGEGGFWYRNYATFIGTGIAAIPLMWVFSVNVFMITTVIGGLVTTQVHYLAHFPARAGRIIKVLQHTGLIQSTKHHASHHSFPHTQNYCILTNILNPILDELKIWDRLEVRLIKLGCTLSQGER